MISPHAARHTLRDTKRATTKKKKIKQRPREAARDWKAVPHHEMIQALQHALANAGFSYYDPPIIYLSRSGYDMDAVILAESPGSAKYDYIPGLGVCCSNARLRSLKFWVGAVAANDRGAVTTGVWATKTPYTTDFDLPDMARRAVEWWKSELPKLDNTIEGLKQRAIVDDNEAKSLLMDAGAAGLTPASRAVRAYKHYLNGGRRSAWDLALAFAWAGSTNPADKQLQQQLGFYRLLTGQTVKV